MEYLFGAAFFVFGLAFGSFLNVCIHRLPRRSLVRGKIEQLAAEIEGMKSQNVSWEEIAHKQGELQRLREQWAGLSIVTPASACPQCHHPIQPYDNIPVLSWLILGGRCRYCRAPITPRYLAVELITGLLFLGCYLRFGLTPLAFKFSLFSFLVVGLVFTDAEWKLLPDSFTLSGLAAGLLLSLFTPVRDVVGQLLPAFVSPASAQHLSWRLLSFADAVFGAAVGASFFYGVAILYQRARGHEGLGLGDVKLMAMVGAFFGVRLTVMTIFGASLVGTIFGLSMILTVWRKRTRRRMARQRESAAAARRRAWRSAQLVYRHYEVPFGVFLGAMAMVALFFGNAFLRWYWSLYL